MTLTVYVGYDEREHEAYRVCRDSLLSDKVDVVPLNHRDLRRANLFSRRWLVDSQGQYWDKEDGKAFSTQFSHSRFLVPMIHRRGWCAFVDCDFLFLERAELMLGEADDRYAVMCRKFMLSGEEEGTKMDGMRQSWYPRKLWSSLMLINCDHPAWGRLSVGRVNTQDGGYLQQMLWLEPHEIGPLHNAWNRIPGIDTEEEVAAARAIHYSLGGPWLPGYEEGPGAALWHRAYANLPAGADLYSEHATF